MEENFDWKAYLLTWDDELLTGVDLIDKDHKEIIERFNKLITAMFEGSGDISIDDVVDLLYDHAENHFNREEELQLKCNYPDYEIHKKLHNDFKENVVKLKYGLNDPSSYGWVLMNIHDDIFAWLYRHIMDVDKKFIDFYKSHL